jgi:PAS domain S-box-containing protein
MTRYPQRAWIPYAAAIAATIAACIGGGLMARVLGDNVLYGVFFAVVAFAAWYGGFGPAMLATVATWVAANWLFVAPHRAFSINAATYVYFFICALVAVIGEAMKRTRRRAESSAEEVAAIVESINDGFVAVDDQWRCTYMNRAAHAVARRHQHGANSATDVEILQLFHGADAEGLLKRAADERTTAEFETFYELWQRWFEIKAAPAEGGGLGIFFRDITERKMAESALAQSEERLRMAQHGAKAGLWDWDMATGEVTWSDEYYEINGLDRSIEPSRKNFLRSVYPDDRAAVEQAIAEAIDARRSIEIEYRIMHPRTGTRWVAGRGRTAVDSSGRALRTSGIVLDITERKEAENALRFLSEAGTVLSALEDFEGTMKNVSLLAVESFADWCVVQVVQPSGKISPLAFAHRDPAREAILKELLDRYTIDRDSPATTARVLRSGKPELAATLPAGYIDSIALDNEHRRLLAELDPVSLIAVPLIMRDKAVGVMSFVRCQPQCRYSIADLELACELARRVAVSGESARLYAELKEAQRQKDDFLAMLAHELRNPLAAIAYANEVSKLTDTSGNGATATIDRQLANLCRLLDDLLDVSRITRDKVQLKREPADGIELARRAVATVGPFIDERKHKLVLEISEEPLPVFVDPIRIEQILGNLLTNAAKYTPEGGTITVRAFQSQDHAIFTVKDTGVGVPPAMLPRIFELFMQVDRSIDRSQGGLGVGLTLVRKLAEMHGGSVSAKSDGPGMGSEFTIRLPLADPSTLAAGTHGERSVAVQPLKVLMVDDNIDLAENISRLLKMCGHTVALAHDGFAAIEAARSFSPDVVLLDLGLPGLDGYRVAQTLRGESSFAQVRFIAFSGYGQPEDRRRTREAGFDHHLVKPVKFQALLSAIADK